MRTTSTDYSRPYRPLPVRLVNGLGSLAGEIGLRAGLDAESLLAAAKRKTGLRDFGDRGFFERLQILTRAIKNHARLHPLGRLMARQNLLRILANRLRLTDAFGRGQNGCLETADPVFIVGLQRTGTTLLHRLLARDPGWRHLESWEAVNPAPLAGGLFSGGDHRPRAAGAAQFVLSYLAPDFTAIHPVAAREPEEDCLLFDYDLHGTVPEALWRVPGFSTWLERQDHTAAYCYYSKILSYLRHRRPGGRWLLKTPQHLEQLCSLFAVFPGARLIQIHRDPLRTMASFCSMMAHSRGVFSDQVDPEDIGRHWFAKAKRMIARSMAERIVRGEEAFLDVSYYDLTADALGTARRIYDWLGIELSTGAAERMRSYLLHNPQHKLGRHLYRLADFGLEQSDVESAFADYRLRFSIPHEDSAGIGRTS